MPISAVDAISPAFHHTKQQLIVPFRFSQWTKLAFVGLLAGELSSGGGCNFNGGNFRIPQHPTTTDNFTGYGFVEHNFAGHGLAANGLAGIGSTQWVAIISFLIVIAVVLYLLLIYLNSMMRFVLFDAVIQKECRIRDGWMRRVNDGWRYFLWQLGLLAASFAALIILAGIPLAIAFLMGWLDQPKEHLVPLILGGVLMFFVFAAFFVLFLVVAVFTKDFIVPQMALEHIGAVEAWRRLLQILKRDKGGFLIYVIMKVVMALGAAIVIGIVTLIVMLLVMIPVGGLGIIAVLGGKAAGLSWNLYTISLAVVFGSIALAVFMYLVSFISVPAIVFFPAYSIYFFAGRYPLLDTLLRTPSGNNLPPEIPPPPILPTPEPIG